MGADGWYEPFMRIVLKCGRSCSDTPSGKSDNIIKLNRYHRGERPPRSSRIRLCNLLSLMGV